MHSDISLATGVPVDPIERDPISLRRARAWLRNAGRLWFLTAFLGQGIFVAYIVLHYGGMVWEGGMAAWASASDNAYVAGDWLGNLAMLSHILLAVVIMVGGPLQLLPVVRDRLPRFHRINGRLYLACVVLTSLAGLYVIWQRGTVGGMVMRVGISLDALLIIGFAGMALYCALTRRFDRHQRWVLRLFFAVSAVWFFRIAFMLWMVLTRGAGIDFETFTGPFPYTLVFAQYLVPLAMLELFWWARSRGSALACCTVLALVVLCTLLTLAGVAAATFGMWLPKLA
jgi:hypothetical protein